LYNPTQSDKRHEDLLTLLATQLSDGYIATIAMTMGLRYE
jgi:hypothetical protein